MDSTESIQKDPVEATPYSMQLPLPAGSSAKLTTARMAAAVDLAAVVRQMQQLVAVLPIRVMQVALAALLLKVETAAQVLHRQLQAVL